MCILMLYPSRLYSLHSQPGTPGSSGKSRLKLLSALDNAGSPHSPPALAASLVHNYSSPLKSSLPATPVEGRFSSSRKRLSKGGPEGDERLSSAVVSSMENVQSRPTSTSPKRLKLDGLKWRAKF